MFRGAGALVPMDEGSLARKTQQDDIWGWDTKVSLPYWKDR